MSPDVESPRWILDECQSSPQPKGILLFSVGGFTPGAGSNDMRIPSTRPFWYMIIHVRVAGTHRVLPSLTGFNPALVSDQIPSGRESPGRGLGTRPHSC